jgi:hypothetical protein
MVAVACKDLVRGANAELLMEWHGALGKAMASLYLCAGDGAGDDRVAAALLQVLSTLWELPGLQVCPRRCHRCPRPCAGCTRQIAVLGACYTSLQRVQSSAFASNAECKDCDMHLQATCPWLYMLHAVVAHRTKCCGIHTC